MKHWFSIPAFILMLALMASTPAGAGEVLDRIVATVNGHAILQSDWDDAIRYEEFVSGAQATRSDGVDRKAVLDRLIDQELLREQMHAADFPHAGEEEVAKRIQELRIQHAEGGSEEGWRILLARAGLTEAGLKEHVALQLELMRLVDARLRPTVNIDGKSIESYYNRELLPELRQSGAKEVSLAAVSGKIKELLTEQKVNELLVAWLQNLRSGSEIRMVADQAAGNQAR